MTNIVIFADVIMVMDFGIELRLTGGEEHHGWVVGPHGWFSIEGILK